MDTKQDGVTHINVFSRGQTDLGRLLSNFAHTPFTILDQVFESVEGWWYWYCTGQKYNHLKSLYGFKAKQEGKKYESVITPTKEILFQIYESKVNSNPPIHHMLVNSTLPFTHYYVFNGEVVQTKWEWTGSLWNEVRSYLKEIEKESRKVLKSAVNTNSYIGGVIMTQEKKAPTERTRLGFYIEGKLAHDNEYWDKKCPQCGRLYSSYVTSNCTNCGHQLTDILTGSGEKMGISEGKVYFLQKPEEREQHARQINATKAVPIVYRFKLFSFAGANEALTPHPEHMNCKKNSIVTIKVLNHELFATPFHTRDGSTQVELMAKVYSRFGDTIKVIKSSEEENRAVTTNTAPKTLPDMPANMNMDELATLVAQKLAGMNKVASEVSSPPQSTTGEQMSIPTEEVPSIPDEELEAMVASMEADNDIPTDDDYEAFDGS